MRAPLSAVVLVISVATHSLASIFIRLSEGEDGKAALLPPLTNRKAAILAILNISID